MAEPIQGKLSERPYVGYEDYSPEGRTAINAFNSMNGPNFLQRQLSTSDKYQAAKQYAYQMALIQKLMFLQMRGAAMGLNNPGALAPSPYQYPPQE